MWSSSGSFKCWNPFWCERKPKLVQLSYCTESVKTRDGHTNVDCLRASMGWPKVIKVNWSLREGGSILTQRWKRSCYSLLNMVLHVWYSNQAWHSRLPELCRQPMGTMRTFMASLISPFSDIHTEFEMAFALCVKRFMSLNTKEHTRTVSGRGARIT